MTKSLLKITLLSFLSLSVAATPLAIHAQDNPKPAVEKKAGKAHNKSGILPFHGNLKALDQKAKTITIGTRTFEITPDTKLFKNGKPATLADAEVGKVASGGFRKSPDGKLIATKVTFGPKAKKTKAKEKASEQASK